MALGRALISGPDIQVSGTIRICRILPENRIRISMKFLRIICIDRGKGLLMCLFLFKYQCFITSWMQGATRRQRAFMTDGSCRALPAQAFDVIIHTWRKERARREATRREREREHATRQMVNACRGKGGRCILSASPCWDNLQTANWLTDGDKVSHAQRQRQSIYRRNVPTGISYKKGRRWSATCRQCIKWN